MPRLRPSTVAVIAVAAAGFFLFVLRSRPKPAQLGFLSVIREAATNPVVFAKEHFTGSIGIALSVTTNRLPIVMMLVLGSTAEQAGLKEGDIILKVNDSPTEGKSMAQIADEIRGLSVGSVNLVIQRGQTNLECTVRRSSWSSLKKPRFNFREDRSGKAP